jgi:hypothetical protein
MLRTDENSLISAALNPDGMGSFFQAAVFNALVLSVLVASFRVLVISCHFGKILRFGNIGNIGNRFFVDISTIFDMLPSYHFF